MARGNRKETFQGPVPFSHVTLQGLELKEIKPPKDERERNFETQISCVFRNPQTRKRVKGSLAVHSRVKMGFVEETTVVETFRATLKSTGTEIRLVMTLYDFPDTALVTSDIGREEKGAGNRLPPGTGIQLYEKGLDLIKSRAVTKPVTHEVRREALTTLETSLNRAQWEKLFVPILKARGYTELSEGHWEKIYLPADNETPGKKQPGL